MNFFSKFPLSTYQFSDKETTVITDLFRYVSAEDKKLDGIINYTYYSVPEGMRPDVLSSKLYGTPDFHWTFFIINTALKQAGLGSWPKGIAELENFIFEKYMKNAVIEMNSITEPYSYTLYDVDSGEGTIKNTVINTKSLNGIALDSDISLVSLDKNHKLEFLSYKNDRIAVKKNIVSSLSFSANKDVYWNLPKITLVSNEGYNAEASFKFSDSVKGRGSILLNEIKVVNAGENYFTPPEVIVDESPERDCVFSFNTTTGALVISYSGQNYCRVPKLIIKTNGYTSDLLNVFEIDISKNYGLKVLNGAYTLPENIRLKLVSNPEAEVSTFTFIGDPAYWGSQYFTIGVPEGQAYVWFDRDNSAPDPEPAGFLRGIRIDGGDTNVNPSENRNDWASAMVAAFASDPHLSASRNGDVITLTSRATGTRSNITLGTVLPSEASVAVITEGVTTAGTVEHVLELTNRDEPLNVPLVYVSNSSEIDQNFETFTLENNSSDNVKIMKWNLDLLNWILNYRIDSIIVNNFITSTDLFNFSLTQDMGLYVYDIAKDIQEKTNQTSLNPSSVTDTSIRLKVTEMVTYFTGTYYYSLAKEIENVFFDSGIDFDDPEDYLISNGYIAKLFYDGINYENKIEGSLIGLSDGWDIPVYSFGSNRPLYTAPTFSLENLYGPYNLPSGRGSIKFGSESIAVQNDTWSKKTLITAGSKKWYSFKIKKIGNNPSGIFSFITHKTSIKEKSVGIELSGNTIFDSLKAPSPSNNSPQNYVHNFGNTDTVTILGYFNTIADYVSINTLWFNPDETLNEASLQSSTTRKSTHSCTHATDTERLNLEQKLSGIGFQNNTGFIVDEIRIGETFESVTKNPAISIPELQNYLSETAENRIVGPNVKNLIFETQEVYGEAQNATHHYEDSNGNQLSYYTGVNNLNGGVNARITNFEYEVALNDQRREIKIVRPEYIKQFDSVYNTLINS